MLRFQVPTMTCGGCAKAVTRTIAAVDPQAKVEVDLASREVAVATTASADSIASALTRAGYEPRPLATAAAGE